MHRAFLHGQFFVPRRQMHHRNLIVAKRTPHHPPAVTDAFQHAAIRAGTTVKRIGMRRRFSVIANLGTPNIVSEEYSPVTRRLGTGAGLRFLRDCQSERSERICIPPASDPDATCTADTSRAGDKFLQPLLPVLRQSAADPAPAPNSVEHSLIHQQIRHAFEFEVIGIELVQRRRQLNPQLRRIQSIPIQDDTGSRLHTVPRRSYWPTA